MIQPQTTAASSPPPVISTVDGPTLQVSNFLNAMHFQRQPKKWSSRLSQGSLATFDLDLRVLSATSNHPKSYLGENWLQGVKYSHHLWQIKSACRQPPGNLKWNPQSIEPISVAPLLTQHAVTTKDPSLRLRFHRTLPTRKISEKRVHWAMLTYFTTTSLVSAKKSALGLLRAIKNSFSSFSRTAEDKEEMYNFVTPSNSMKNIDSLSSRK